MAEGDALDAPDHPHPHARHGWKRWPRTRRITTPSTRSHGGRGRPGRDGITTRGRSRGRMGRARISTPPPPLWRKGKGGRCAGSSPAPARRGGRDATDAPGSPPPAPPAAGEWDALNVPDHHPPAPAAVGRKNRRVYARLFYLLVKNQCIIFCHLMPLKFLLGTRIYFYHFCSRHRIRAMFRI